MGYYIQAPALLGKAAYIASNLGGEVLVAPPKFEDIPEGKALIVVVNNGPFEAAGFAFSKDEYDVFMPNLQDPRPREYVLIDWDKACSLTGYKPS